MNRLRRVHLAAGLAAALLMLVTVVVVFHGRDAEAATLSQTDAVSLAIRYAQTPSLGGRLSSAPTNANAKLTTLADAWQLKNGTPLDPSTQLGGQSNRSVWLVFLRGDVTVPNQQVPGGTAAAAPTYHQVSVILDANTGELLSIGLHPPAHEVAAAGTLPAVVIPPGAPNIVPPILNNPTEAPLPTRPLPPGSSAGQTSVPAAPPQPGQPQATATPARR